MKAIERRQAIVGQRNYLKNNMVIVNCKAEICANKKEPSKMLDSQDIKLGQKFTDGSLHPRGVCYNATNDRAKN